ncbi:MAG: response regulator [Archangium sp.]|nr:response regulator [Archangium sp.]
MVPRAVLESVVAQASAAIWLVDASHRVVWANDATSKMAGGCTEGAKVLEDVRQPFVLVREQYLQAQAFAEHREWCSPVSAAGRRLSGWTAPWMEEGARQGTVCLLRDVPTACESQLTEALHSVLDQIPDPVAVRAANGAFLLANQACATLYGTSPALLVGRFDRDFSAPTHGDALRDGARRLMSSSTAEATLEHSRDETTGETRHFRAIKRPFKNAQGDDQLLVIAQDVTDVVRGQERIAESEQRLQEVLSVTHEAVWDWHVPSGRVKHNPQWYALLGLRPGDEADTVEAFATHLHPDDHDAVFARLDEVVSGRVEVYRSEHRLLTTHGVIHVKDRGRVVERDGLGHAVRVVGSFTDITAEWRATEALRQARITAEQANLAKSRFLATMSHELRTPLNGILGMAQVLLGSSHDPQALDAARTILDSGQTLLCELNDILDLSKIEAGKLMLEPQPFTTRSLMAGVQQLFGPKATEAGLRLEVVDHTQDRLVCGDVTRLRQVLNNLVANALKFTPRGAVTISVDERRADTHQVELEWAVTDTGIGIAKEHLPLLFEPFTQADSSTTRRFGGTGLGLSIVRRLVELMGGTIGVDSALHAGSRFWFRVTLPRAAAASSPSSSPPLPRLSGLRVLAVEDNLINQKVILALLAKLGADAVAVENGVRAVELLTQTKRPQLVLMDCQMPEMDGLEATRRVRAWERTRGLPPIPIIAVTASAYDEDRARCLAAGMNELLPKPVVLEALGSAIRRWLEPMPRLQLSG